MKYETFQRLCDQKGVTQTQVARDIGVNQSVLANWKRRGGNLSSENIRKIAMYFNVSLDDLMTGNTTQRISESGQVYHLDDYAVTLAETIYSSHELSVLFDAVKDLSDESLKELQRMAEHLQLFENRGKRLSAYEDAYKRLSESGTWK